MPPITLPNLALSSEWAARESGWKPGMEANLRILDRFAQLSIKDKDLNAPPGSPASGDSYIVGGSPTGAWSGHAKAVAVYETILGVSGWSFYAPRLGLVAYVEDEALLYAYNGSAWSAYRRIPASATRFIPAAMFGGNTIVRTTPADNGIAEYISFPFNATTDAVCYFLVPDDFVALTSFEIFMAMMGTSTTGMVLPWGYTVLDSADQMDELAPEYSTAIATPSAGNNRVSIKTLGAPAGAPALAPGKLVKAHFHRDDASDPNGDDMRFIGLRMNYTT